MRKLPIDFALLTLVLLAGGCGSLFRHPMEDERDTRLASTRTDMEWFRVYWGGPRHKLDFEGGNTWLTPITVVDLPFAVVRDAVSYPYAAWSYHAHLEDERFWEGVFRDGAVPAEGLRRHWTVYTDEQVSGAIQGRGVSSNLVDAVLAAAMAEDRATVIAAVSALPKLPLEKCITLYEWQKTHPETGQRVRCNLAKQPIVPMEMLLALAKTDELTQVEILKTGRLCRDMSNEMLARLARSDNWKVKAEVARNPGTSPDVLTALAKEAVRQDKTFDEWYGGAFPVSCALASNTNTPPEAFDVLVQETQPPLRQIIAKNPCAPTHILETLMTDQGDLYFILWAMARNTGAPRSIIETLAQSDKTEVRKAAKVELQRRDAEEQKKAEKPR